VNASSNIERIPSDILLVVCNFLEIQHYIVRLAMCSKKLKDTIFSQKFSRIVDRSKICVWLFDQCLGKPLPARTYAFDHGSHSKTLTFLIHSGFFYKRCKYHHGGSGCWVFVDIDKNKFFWNWLSLQCPCDRCTTIHHKPKVVRYFPDVTTLFVSMEKPRTNTIPNKSSFQVTKEHQNLVSNLVVELNSQQQLKNSNKRNYDQYVEEENFS